MTNTINNVPFELLETLIEQHITAHGFTNHTARQAQLILCAPSPAGVDGLEVFITDCATCIDVVPAKTVTDARVVLAKDAQAIIDGLRGDLAVALKVPSVAAMHAYLDTECAKDNMRLGAERDRQAQRIGELEGLLREVHGWIDESARVYRHNSTSVMLYRIDAALSAGKEGE